MNKSIWNDLVFFYFKSIDSIHLYVRARDVLLLKFQMMSKEENKNYE